MQDSIGQCCARILQNFVSVARHARRHPRQCPRGPSHASRKTIAIYIVGPIQRSRSGKAVAMRTINAQNVAQELVKLITRVGIPSEILTNQVTNLTLQPDRAILITTCMCLPNPDNAIPPTDSWISRAVRSDS